jgi:hypothetical protein
MSGADFILTYNKLVAIEAAILAASTTAGATATGPTQVHPGIVVDALATATPPAGWKVANGEVVPREQFPQYEEVTPLPATSISAISEGQTLPALGAGQSVRVLGNTIWYGNGNEGVLGGIVINNGGTWELGPAFIPYNHTLLAYAAIWGEQYAITLNRSTDDILFWNTTNNGTVWSTGTSGIDGGGLRGYEGCASYAGDSDENFFVFDTNTSQMYIWEPLYNDGPEVYSQQWEWANSRFIFPGGLGWNVISRWGDAYANWLTGDINDNVVLKDFTGAKINPSNLTNLTNYQHYFDATGQSCQLVTIGGSPANNGAGPMFIQANATDFIQLDLRGKAFKNGSLGGTYFHHGVDQYFPRLNEYYQLRAMVGDYVRPGDNNNTPCPAILISWSPKNWTFIPLHPQMPTGGKTLGIVALRDEPAPSQLYILLNDSGAYKIFRLDFDYTVIANLTLPALAPAEDGLVKWIYVGPETIPPPTNAPPPHELM